MDNTTVVLGVAILIVLVLITNCIQPRRRQVRRRIPSVQCVQPRRYSYQIPDIEGMPENNFNKSEWGQGVINRQLDAQNRRLQNASFDDYSQVAMYQSLEPEVFASHDSFAGSIGIANKGASTMTIRSDPNDIVNWVGLRRPKYHDAYADESARTVHSENPDQLYESKGFLL